MGDTDLLREIASSLRTVQGQQVEILTRIDTQATATTALGARVTLLAIDVADLKRIVHGDKPPSPSTPPLAEAIEEAQGTADEAKGAASSASLEAAALEGRTLVAISKLEKKIDGVAAQNEAQNVERGIGLRGWRFVSSREGQRMILRTLTAGAALVAALGGLMGACRGGVAPLAPSAHLGSP